MASAAEVREKLLDALRLDLVGPTGDLGDPKETLPQAPSRWYLTGFLVPTSAGQAQKQDDQADDELDGAGDGDGMDDDTPPEPAAARARYLPSSMGLSVLVSATTKALRVQVTWGDYDCIDVGDGHGGNSNWKRQPGEADIEVDLSNAGGPPREISVPGGKGLHLTVTMRDVSAGEGKLPKGTRSVSIFLVNRRIPREDALHDQTFAFQTELAIESEQPFVARPNLRSLQTADWDEKVADLQYRDACEYGVGHNVSTAATMDRGECRRVHTCWIPEAEVERVAPADIPGVELDMDVLASLADANDAATKLGGFVTAYREWLKAQAKSAEELTKTRKEVANELLGRARTAADRIDEGIGLLTDERVLDAFRIANRAMAAAARQRMGVMLGKNPQEVLPRWRPFQLAFLLMNLKGIAEPTSDDRQAVDLLFFPTGGGKTEAYLGLAAFTLVLRRLQNPGIASAGLSVLMRYTLRLLTLDQLSRAATLICALELERQQDVDKLGTWSFEIGLWVGKGATPNVMGEKGEQRKDTARAKTLAFLNDDRKPSPIPLENCPWCGTKFTKNSFRLLPNPDYPTDLRVGCSNRSCRFIGNQHLPILAVDEPIYRRLPCFLIATVDKFAAMPWTGEVGAFFGRVDRFDQAGFYGPCRPNFGKPLPAGRLLPPDLVIQDELHLISGPLGTVVGLYETALDELSAHEVDGRKVHPKIVASTATVRRADSQIRALFNRSTVEVFPAPGPDRHDSFFAQTTPSTESPARLYVGVAAQGRSAKVVMLRVYLALLAASERWYALLGKKGEQNPVDPYKTVLGYFNSLRELGGARRVIEDEVHNRVAAYSTRKRVGEKDGLFADRIISREPVELTSRVDTSQVAEAKRRLDLPMDEKGKVDVAIATNMISVGLDIPRLGLMVVFGQPKTSSEYIQATSRVGRDIAKPGLVVTILNVHKPRDRSHYERFGYYHETFYRSVEATSVTPFSPRALDRALAGTLVALARQGHSPMTPPKGASEILKERMRLEFAVDVLVKRAKSHAKGLSKEDREKLGQRVRDRARDLLDEWSKLAKFNNDHGTQTEYQLESGQNTSRLLFEYLHPELKNLPSHHAKMKFRANRSMRDVEPSVNLWLRDLSGLDLDEEDE